MLFRGRKVLPPGQCCGQHAVLTLFYNGADPQRGPQTADSAVFKLYSMRRPRTLWSNKGGNSPVSVPPQPPAPVVRRVGARLIFGIIATLLLTVVNIYRATTVSIAGDEALTYHWFVRDSWRHLFTSYDANHHVLHTLLAKASVSLFPVSEFSLRLPALGAGVLYLVAAFRVSAFLCSSFVPYAFCYLTLCLNPLVLDFLSCARGYGLAVAALLWAIHECVRQRAGAPSRPVWLGVWCSVAVCANLTLAVPVAALFTVQAAHYLAKGKALRPLLMAAAITALISVMILAPPLRHASMSTFYAGTETVGEAFRSLIVHSIPEAGRPDRLWVAAALLILATVMAIGRPHAPQALPVQILLLCLAGLYAAHRLVGLPLPLNRTGLYLIPLFTLAVAGAVEMLPCSMPGKSVKLAVGGIAILILFFYVKGIRLDRYALWPQDSATKPAVDTIRRRIAQENLPRPVRVAATNWLYPGLEYYAVTQPGWFVSRVVDRGCVPFDSYFAIPPSGEPDPLAAGTAKTQPRYNFYLILHFDWVYLEDCGLAELERYPEAGVLLAAPADVKPGMRQHSGASIQGSAAEAGNGAPAGGSGRDETLRLRVWGEAPREHGGSTAPVAPRAIENRRYWPSSNGILWSPDGTAVPSGLGLLPGARNRLHSRNAAVGTKFVAGLPAAAARSSSPGSGRREPCPRKAALAGRLNGAGSALRAAMFRRCAPGAGCHVSGAPCASLTGGRNFRGGCRPPRSV